MISLNLKTIRGAHEQFEQQYVPDQLARDGDSFRVAAPARLTFDVFKDNDQFRLVGCVQTTLELECGRCLEPFPRPIDSNFDLRYQPHSRNTGEGEREIDEDDLTTAFYENEAIDLGQLIREQFYLSLPMKPLCSVGCKGLCAMCGTNLNLEECDCSTRWDDPRLAPLKALRSDVAKERDRH